MNIHYKNLLVKVFSIIGYLFSGVYKVYQKLNLTREFIYGQTIKYSFSKPRPSILLAVKPISVVRGKQIQIGERVLIGKHSMLSVWSKGGGIIISDDVIIGSFAHITAINRIVLKKGVLLGKNVTITDNSHGLVSFKEIDELPIKRQLYSKGPVIIGKNVWIGDKVTILPNVTIGDYSIIGANTVVTKDIPPYSVVCGNPGIIIKKIQ